ncbi:MAG: M23 family metallopeptidase, partial [Acidobacteriota bacterium]
MSFEPKRVFIIGSSDEGESILLHVSMENRTAMGLYIDRLIIKFKKKEKIILEQEQTDTFFRRASIKRERKILPGSSVRWTGICLTSPSFGQLDRVELLFHLRSGKKLRTTQVLEIPVSRYLQKTVLRLPFRGSWKVTQGHQCNSNHRISGYGGDFSWDFAAIGENGSIATKDYHIYRRNRDVYSFGRDVSSPASGKIVRVKNDIADNEGEQSYPRKSLSYEVENPLWLFGNFVIIDHGNGEYSLLGHMMNGSIQVKEGDEVKAGDIIGKCGN